MKKRDKLIRYSEFEESLSFLRSTHPLLRRETTSVLIQEKPRTNSIARQKIAMIPELRPRCEVGRSEREFKRQTWKREWQLNGKDWRWVLLETFPKWPIEEPVIRWGWTLELLRVDGLEGRGIGSKTNRWPAENENGEEERGQQRHLE